MPVKLDKLQLNPTNPRTIKDEQFKKLLHSLRTFPGMLSKRPLVVDKMIVLGGNMRLSAIKDIFMIPSEVDHSIWQSIRETGSMPDEWVSDASTWSPEEKKQFVIKDNLSYGEWDFEQLRGEEWDTNQLSEWGLDVPDFYDSQSTTEDDFIIPAEIKTDIIYGDLFEIGQHRLLCGDSTNKEDVVKLFDSCKPVLMVTDPPYGVNYDPAWRNKFNLESFVGKPNRATGKVENDNEAEWDKAYSLFTGDVAYVWHAGKYTDIVLKNLKDSGFEPVSQIIWAKQHFVFSRGDYHWQHEPCWYVVRKGKKHNWAGDRKQSTLWDIMNNGIMGNAHREEQTSHGTQKPVECMARPIRNNSFERDTVYDPFTGSGTSMVAADKLNRKCLSMEIMPTYCQLTIDRMIKLAPDIEIKKNGVKYVQEL